MKHWEFRSLLPAIAVVEIAVTVIYLIRRIAFLAAIVAAGILGARCSRASAPAMACSKSCSPVLLGVSIWIGPALRQSTSFSPVLPTRTEMSAKGVTT